jgi:hypothetical protein
LHHPDDTLTVSNFDGAACAQSTIRDAPGCVDPSPPDTLQREETMHRRAFLATTAAAATAVTLKGAAAATVPPLGETGVPTRPTEPLPLGPLQGGRYPDSHVESLVKPKGAFGASGFPAFAGTMAVERVATGFRWAEGPVYFPGGALRALQRHPQQSHHALFRG